MMTKGDETSNLTGLVLAGGESRRFGRDKRRALFKGRMMIEHALDALRPVCDTMILATGSDPEQGSPLQFSDVSNLADRYTEAGPLAGIHAGMQAAETEWIVVVPCDMPGLSTASIRRITSACSPGVQAVITREPGGQLVPVCACYRSGLEPRVTIALTRGSRTLTTFCRELTFTVVDLTVDEALNVNQPSDLRNRKGQ